MADNVFIEYHLDRNFKEVSALDFYRDVFPLGELQGSNESGNNKYSGIALELLSKVEEGKPNCKRYLLKDDLKGIDKVLKTNNFVIISPISYIGKKRESKNARKIYAIAMDLDGIDNLNRLKNLFHQMYEVKRIPIATYTVFSGGGVHLYWLLEEPISCFDNVVKEVYNLKKGLTKLIWHDTITSLYDKPQIQSLFQGFRMVGTKTKGGNRTKAYKTGEKVSLKYLNSFVGEQYKIKTLKYISSLSLEEAKEKYPEWYERRIENKQPKGTWQNDRALYDWWKRKINDEAQEGHRYYCIMVLSIYAKKCGISYKELEQDAFSFIDRMEKLTVNDDNHFTREDIIAALEMYNDSYITFPIHSIVDITNIRIDKNKRNGRTRDNHLKLCRKQKEALKEIGELKNDGRPSKKHIVKQWQAENPKGTKKDCVRETGLSVATVYKHWEEVE